MDMIPSHIFIENNITLESENISQRYLHSFDCCNCSCCNLIPSQSSQPTPIFALMYLFLLSPRKKKEKKLIHEAWGKRLKTEMTTCPLVQTYLVKYRMEIFNIEITSEKDRQLARGVDIVAKLIANEGSNNFIELSISIASKMQSSILLRVHNCYKQIYK